jgi:hypothetical protein
VDLVERINSGEIKVIEQGPERFKSSEEGSSSVNGEYRILSDGRRQWRQLKPNGDPSPFWKWQDVRR